MRFRTQIGYLWRQVKHLFKDHSCHSWDYLSAKLEPDCVFWLDVSFTRKFNFTKLAGNLNLFWRLSNLARFLNLSTMLKLFRISGKFELIFEISKFSAFFRFVLNLNHLNWREIWIWFWRLSNLAQFLNLFTLLNYLELAGNLNLFLRFVLNLNHLNLAGNLNLFNCFNYLIIEF